MGCHFVEVSIPCEQSWWASPVIYRILTASHNFIVKFWGEGLRLEARLRLGLGLVWLGSEGFSFKARLYKRMENKMNLCFIYCFGEMEWYKLGEPWLW